jgi:hypothetical protein
MRVTALSPACLPFTASLRTSLATGVVTETRSSKRRSDVSSDELEAETVERLTRAATEILRRNHVVQEIPREEIVDEA